MRGVRLLLAEDFIPPWASQRRHVMRARLAASLVVDNVKRDALALLEPKGIRDVAPVDENIRAAVIRSDETEAAIFLPTSTRTRCHFVVLFPFAVLGRVPRKKHPALLPGGGQPQKDGRLFVAMEKSAANW
jgi:hypothetical protein